MMNLANPSQIGILVLVFKGFFVVAALLYLIFATLVVRQINVMRTTLITSFAPFIKTLGFIHFGIAVGVFVFYIIFL